MSDTVSQKPTRERSKAYPGATLEDCVKFTGMIKKELGRGTHDRDSLAQAMGFGSVSGTVSPKIAALVHFGFLDRTASGYELSEASKSVTDAITDQERIEAIKAAFSKPTLYQEILAKFEADGKIPGQLATHLHRFHGITASASGSAAEIFLASGRFAGVLDDNNNIRAGLDSHAYQSSEPPLPETHQPQRDAALPLQNAPSPLAPVAFQFSASNQQRFEFAITRGRTVVLVVPTDLNAKDIKVIRKQVELLELQAGLDDDLE